MAEARFNREGGPLTVKVISGYAQPGSYTLQLWEAEQNLLVGWPPHGNTRPSGNFINTADDTYQLPLPVEGNNQQLLECLIVIVVTPPTLDYRLAIEVYQDGQLMGTAEREGEGKAFEPVLADLFINLVGV